MHMTYQSKWHQRWTERVVWNLSRGFFARAFRNVNRARVLHLFTGFFSTLNREPSDLNSRYKEKRKDEERKRWGRDKGRGVGGLRFVTEIGITMRKEPGPAKSLCLFQLPSFPTREPPLTWIVENKEGEKKDREEEEGTTITFNIRSRVRSLFFVSRDDRTNANDILNIPRISFSFSLEAATFRCASAHPKKRARNRGRTGCGERKGLVKSVEQ